MIRSFPLTLALAIASGLGTLGLVNISSVKAQENPAIAQAPSDYQVIEGNGWSFAVPSDWENTQIPNPAEGTVAVVAQLRDPQSQVFVNLVTEPFEGDPETYIQLNVENMTSVGFMIHRQEEVTAGAAQASELESTIPSTPPVRAIQVVTADNGTGFALTCGGLEANFENIRSTCEEVLGTFDVN